MSGNKYLLDTNFILGLLKSDPLVLAEVSSRQIHVDECSYSAITRMELLGFHSITREEESLIRQKLDRLTYLPLTGNRKCSDRPATDPQDQITGRNHCCNRAVFWY
ncbi:MAG: hypothetical protein ABI479_04845 [Gallionella sp.]